MISSQKPVKIAMNCSPIEAMKYIGATSVKTKIKKNRWRYWFYGKNEFISRQETIRCYNVFFKFGGITFLDYQCCDLC